MWDIGTATFTNGSKVVTKTGGSDWTNPLVGVAPSRAIIDADGNWFEIEFIISANELRIRDNYTGTTGEKAYRVPTSPNVPVETFALEQSAFVSWLKKLTEAWQAITTGTGDVTITDPISGEETTVRSQQAWDAALNGKADISSPTFTGTPAAPTALVGTNTTQIATTAFVTAAVSGKADPASVYPLKGPLGTLDLNDVVGTAYQGIWTQGATANATTARNYPIVSAGSLEVIYNAANNYGTIQRYTTHASNRVFIRYKAASADAWSAWVEQAYNLKNTIGQVSQFFGYDASNLTQLENDLGLSLQGAGFQSAYGTDRRFQLFMDTNNVMRYRFSATTTAADAATAWKTVINAEDAQTIGNQKTFQRDTAPILLRPLTADAAITLAAQTYNGSANTWQIGKFSSGDNTVQFVNSVVGSGVVLLASGAVRLTPASTSVDAVVRRSGSDYKIWDYNNISTDLGFGYAGTSPTTTDFNAIASSGLIKAFKSPANGTNWPTTDIAWVGQNWAFNDGASASIAILPAATKALARVMLHTRRSDVNLGWSEFALLETAQTFSGNKYFSGALRKTGNGPTIDMLNTGLTDGTIGKHIRFNAASDGRLYFLHDPSESSSTGRITIGLPRTANGTILVSGNNAIADSSGYWKTASPVVKLFTDGTSELTAEAEGVTTERISEGVYKITGCLGLNADRAWGGDDGGIDVPMCRNKLPRMWVDYGGDEGSQINEDGSIVIRTYHRTHPDAMPFARNEIEGYSNGDPIDIPSDVFLMVRVQMPVVEETETSDEAEEESTPEEVEQTYGE